MAKPSNKGGGRGRPGKDRNGVGWMSKASPMAWVGVVTGLFAITINIGTVGFIYAGVLASLDRNRDEIARNFKEDDRHREEYGRHISRIDTNMGSMKDVFVKIGIIENQLMTLNETMRDIKRGLERPIPPSRLGR